MFGKYPVTYDLAPHLFCIFFKTDERSGGLMS